MPLACIQLNQTIRLVATVRRRGAESRLAACGNSVNWIQATLCRVALTIASHLTRGRTDQGTEVTTRRFLNWMAGRIRAATAQALGEYQSPAFTLRFQYS